MAGSGDVTLRPLFSPGAGRVARHRAAGQSTVEWLGVVVAVAVLALTVIAAAPGMASNVGSGIERIVCTVGAAAGSAASCLSPAAEQAVTQTPVRTVIEATGGGGLRPGAAAAGGWRGKTFAAGGTNAASGLVPAVSSEDAKTQFAFGGPQCRETGPSQSASQLCTAADGTLRDCSLVDPVQDTVSCNPRISDTTLAEQATCAAAPNALAADPASTQQLCRTTRKDGSTAIARCSVDSVAGKTDGSGGTESLRTCVDTSQDPYATTDPAKVTCPGGWTGPFADTRDGRKVWRFDSVCLSQGGSAYLCEKTVEQSRRRQRHLGPTHPPPASPTPAPTAPSPTTPPTATAATCSGSAPVRSSPLRRRRRRRSLAPSRTTRRRSIACCSTRRSSTARVSRTFVARQFPLGVGGSASAAGFKRAVTPRTRWDRRCLLLRRWCIGLSRRICTGLGSTRQRAARTSRTRRRRQKMRWVTSSPATPVAQVVAPSGQPLTTVVGEGVEQVVLGTPPAPSTQALIAAVQASAGGATVAVQIQTGLGAQDLPPVITHTSPGHLTFTVGANFPATLVPTVAEIEAAQAAHPGVAPGSASELAVLDHLLAEGHGLTALGSPPLNAWHPGAGAPLLGALLSTGAPFPFDPASGLANRVADDARATAAASTQLDGHDSVSRLLHQTAVHARDVNDASSFGIRDSPSVAALRRASLAFLDAADALGHHRAHSVAGRCCRRRRVGYRICRCRGRSERQSRHQHRRAAGRDGANRLR